ncbi:DUF2690 domain-containing protein [Streptomyces sp. CC210A]|uniref:DUF2690 domain-containing protein n=1 Tax=Streptomyces sp. CC210A TaxID=2898184 RepID=UPI001F2B4651|nr:DUF2690 domain-containing protein [Streptomyces sp. CC210A]
MLVAGAVGALLVVAGAVLLADPGGDRGAGRRRRGPLGVGLRAARRLRRARAHRPGPAARRHGRAHRCRPPGTSGAGCFGDGCAGRDPESTRCGRPHATTVAYRTVGTARVEVRHSRVCGAAWARISGAAPGDVVAVSAAGATHERAVRSGDDDAYTLMVAVSDATDARACATLAGGLRGCTGPD